MAKFEWLKGWASNNIYKHLWRFKYVAYHNPSFSFMTKGIENK
jgi:hypothetical protein